MTGLDFTIIGTFFVATILVGLSDVKNVTLEVYWVNGRNTRRFALLASTLSTFIGAGSIFGLAGTTFSGAGLLALAIPASFLIYFVVFGAFFAPKIKAYGDTHRAFTLPDFLESTYSRRVRIAGATVNLVSVALSLALQFLSFGVIVSSLIGLDPVMTTIGGGLLMITYATVGGMRADIRTDVFQFCVMLVLLSVCLPLVAWKSGGLAAIEALPADFLRGEHFAPPYVMAAALVFLGASVLSSPDFWQRAYAAESKESLRFAMFSGGALAFLFLSMGVCFGLFARSVMPGAEANEIVPALFRSMLPSGLYGLSIAGLFAALLSTGDTLLLVMSMTIVHDFYRKGMGRELTPERALRLSRFLVVGVGIAALAIAVVIFSVVHLAIQAVSFGVVLVPSIVFGFYSPRPNERAAFWSILCGAATILVVQTIRPAEAFVPGMVIAFLVYAVIARGGARDVDVIAVE